MKKFMMIVIGLLLSFQMLQANQIEKTVVLNAGYNAVQFDANVTLEELKNKIGAKNLLNIQGAGQGSTYKKQYVDDGLEFLNSFTQTEAGKAFWFKVVEDVNFTYMADKQVNNKVIALGEGWSFIGAMIPLTLEEMKSQLGEDNLLIIQGAGQGSTYKKEYVDNGTPFLNSFTAFEVGKGYWVKVASPATLSFVFNLDKIAKDNAGNSAELTRTIGGEVYTVRVYSDREPTTIPSQGTMAIYGNLNGNPLSISFNDTYPEGTRFQVKVFDVEGKEMVRSDIANFTTEPIEFDDIEFEIPCISRADLEVKIANDEDVTQVNTGCITEVGLHSLVYGLNNEGDRYYTDSFNNGCSNISNTIGLTNPFWGNPDNFILDYSHGGANNLDEVNGIVEENGLGYPNSGTVDFNCNESSNDILTDFNVNKDGITDSLHEHDDWSAINIIFSRTYSGSLGITNKLSQNMSKVEHPVWNDIQEVSREPSIKIPTVRATK